MASTYLVGGAVRDAMLGLPVRERDYVVVGATPQAMTAAGYTAVGRDFPVFLHPDTHEEYALARTERKSGRGYHGFVFHTGEDVTLEDDLIRRDLTVNAMARDADGKLIDPHGGQRDLQARILRHVSPAFAEDPVRLLRLARFYARFQPLGFTVAEETMTLLRSMVEAGEIDHLVPERVWAETRRSLAGDAPQHFFQLLRDTGALARLFPELDAQFGVPQPAKHHPEIDAGVHTLLALEQAARANTDTATRYAVLCHDYGKGITPREILPSHRGHEDAGVPLVEACSHRLGVPKAYRELAVLVTRWHLHVHRARELRPATVLKLLNAADALRRPERLEQLLAASEADARGRTGLEERAYPQAGYLREARAVAAGVVAREVVADGFSGPAVGKELERRRIQALRDWRQSVSTGKK